MPSSDDGNYVKHKDDDDASSTQSSEKDSRSRKSSVKSDHTGSRNDDPYGSGDIPLSKKFHIISLILYITTFICLLAIIPTRSLGVSGKLDQGEGLSVGFWNHCLQDICNSGWGDSVDGQRTAGGVFGIFAILVCFVMILLQVFQFLKDSLSFFLKLQCLLNHVLWLFILISWACWAGVHNTIDNDLSRGIRIYYAWGFLFLIFMWLIQMIVAIHLTLKALGRKTCC